MKLKLSKRELLYSNVMKSGNVLYLKGRPGEAKSAIGRVIAEKIGFNYITLPLAQMDAVDLGQFPSTKTNENGLTVVEFATPEWAIEANSRPTIIHFEELNRSRKEVRDAALLILNEKEVGRLKLNKNVYLMASGNLGDEDGTDVDEMDNAIINRLFVYKHELTVNEWIENFALENVLPEIVSFIHSKPEHFYKFSTEFGQPYATPRSWTNLSNYIKILDTKTVSDIYNNVSEVGLGFVGNSSIFFLKWLEDEMSLSINDIIDNFDKLKINIKKIGRHKISELLTSLKLVDLESLNDNQIENVIKFIELIESVKENKDELVGYLLNLINQLTIDMKKCDNIKKIAMRFKGILKEIKNEMDAA